MDHDGITVILAGALLSDEHMNHMYGHSAKAFLKVLFTDRDLNFIIAIAEVFACTTHHCAMGTYQTALS